MLSVVVIEDQMGTASTHTLPPALTFVFVVAFVLSFAFTVPFVFTLIFAFALALAVLSATTVVARLTGASPTLLLEPSAASVATEASILR
jgi:energy-coupling factor transporter transmembrane protein EcfT